MPIAPVHGGDESCVTGIERTCGDTVDRMGYKTLLDEGEANDITIVQDKE